MDHVDDASSPLGSTSTNSRSCADRPGLLYGEKPWSPERGFSTGAPGKSEVSLEIEKSKSLAERRSCCETARLGDNSKKDRDFATIKTPSNSSAG